MSTDPQHNVKTDENESLKARVAELEQRLALTDQQLATFFENALDMLCVMGADGYFKMVNPRWEQTLGYSRAELLSRPFLELIHPDDRPATQRLVEQLAGSAGDVVAFENRYLARDGSYRRLLWNGTKPPGQDVFYGIARDVTEQRQAEEASQAQASLMAAILERMADALILVDTNGKLLVTNPAAVALFGEKLLSSPAPDQWVDTYGLRKSDMTPYRTEELPGLRALEGEESAEVEMFVGNGADPRGIWITANSRPLVNPDGTVRGSLMVCRDVTARKALEKDLEARTQRLLDSEVEKAELIDRLRHAVDELSTPILELWDDVLAMPIIGVVDSRRSADMVNRILNEVVRSQAQFVILDLTGVDLIDTKTADHFIRLVKTVELTGAHCIVTGIRPAVAQTLVDLGVDFGRLGTFRNLRHGLRECLRVREGSAPVRRFPGHDDGVEKTFEAQARARG